jgi:hypothetical protein
MANRTMQRFAEVLKKAGLVDDLQLKAAIAECEQWGKRLPRVLGELGFANEDEMLDVLAGSLRTPVAHLGNVRKDDGAVKALGPEFCEKNGVFPVTLKDRLLTLAMADPTDLRAIDEAGAKAAARVSVVMASESEIISAINRHFYGKELAAPRRNLRKAERVSSGVTGEIPIQVPPEPPPEPDFPPELRPRLDAAVANQEKVGAILRAVQQLLREKGLTR